jgi:hypothetical protein
MRITPSHVHPALQGAPGARHRRALPEEAHGQREEGAPQAWELDVAIEAERLIRDLAKRMEKEASGVCRSLLEGLDKILTVNRLGLPLELRRALACTNAPPSRSAGPPP